MTTRMIPPLHEGHAPVFLHLAFDDALDAYEGWGLDMDEPVVVFEDKSIPISSVFGRMRSCTDLLPSRTVQAVEDVTGAPIAGLVSEPVTYASAAFLLRALAGERLKQSGIRRDSAAA